MQKIHEYILDIYTYYALPALESLLVVLVGILAYHLFQRMVRRLSRKGFIAYQLQVMLVMLSKILVGIIVFLTILGRAIWCTGIAITRFCRCLECPE